jgi:hypothetical protein
MPTLSGDVAIFARVIYGIFFDEAGHKVPAHLDANLFGRLLEEIDLQPGDVDWGPGDKTRHQMLHDLGKFLVVPWMVEMFMERYKKFDVVEVLFETSGNDELRRRDRWPRGVWETGFSHRTPGVWQMAMDIARSPTELLAAYAERSDERGVYAKKVLLWRSKR